ncbi:uncharacterized protein LOC117231422 [Bombus vosnesenskii]|uniref:Uncharacterized protein LOC117231422 n=1 Tax=Bombus vosnesenskii TaxID=207650 RepID=A0A6J3JY25_9HYME|nr:uncharacterized protein LOC117156806 [Bombus vancouverensis nearcticus]XP_033345747.1 uncharacterized protein LOC117231422 [Bombus vosnesenskii]
MVTVAMLILRRTCRLRRPFCRPRTVIAISLPRTRGVSLITGAVCFEITARPEVTGFIDFLRRINVLPTTIEKGFCVALPNASNQPSSLERLCERRAGPRTATKGISVAFQRAKRPSRKKRGGAGVAVPGGSGRSPFVARLANLEEGRCQ